MTSFATSTPILRRMLDPRQVERLDPQEIECLVRVARQMLTAASMAVPNRQGGVVYVGTSVAKLTRLAKESLRTFPFEKALQTMTEHIRNLIDAERESYRRARLDQRG